jgi:predicted nuclease with TOPRIM domain
MLFDKKEIKSLAALKGIKAADITAEQIASVNADLNEIGIEGVELNVTGKLTTVISDLAASKKETGELAEKVKTLETEKTDLSQKITGLEGEKAELTTRLEKMPAAVAEEPEAEVDKITSEGSPDKLVSEAQARMEEQMGL